MPPLFSKEGVWTKMFLTKRNTLFSILFLTLMFLLVPGISYAYSGGSGTAEDPYLISTQSDLNQVRNNLGAHFKLSNDIDLSTVNWVPVGTSNAPFTGVFDGNGHTIHNLYINQGGNHIGFFGYINRGTVKDLGFEGANIHGGSEVGTLAGRVNGTITNVYTEDGTVSGNIDSVGGLVGYQSSGTITDSYAVSEVSGNNNVGGLVGYQYYSTITDSYAAGPVGGNSYVGGLVGYQDSGTITYSYAAGPVGGNSYAGGLVGYQYTSAITNSYAAGPVIGNSNVGGLVGRRNGGTIINSYAVGTVSGGSYVGGLVAGGGGTTTNSYWDAEASGQASSAGGTGKLTFLMKQPETFVGFDFVSVWQIDEGTSYPYLRGLPKPSEVVIGTTGDGSMAGGSGTAEDPYLISTFLHLDKMRWVPNAYFKLINDIDLSGVNWLPVGTQSVPFTGVFDGNGHTIHNLYINQSGNYIGLFGYINGGTVKDLGFEGANIHGGSYVGTLAGYVKSGTVTNVYTEDGTVSGNSDHVGGLVGDQYGGGAITDSYAVSEVSGNNNVGGLVGYQHGTITNSYAISEVSGNNSVGGLVGYQYGTITNSYAISEVSGNEKVGGLVGYQYGTITDSYAAGSVSGNSYVGGLLGLKDGGTTTNSYWDAEASGQAGSAGGTGKTTAEMKMQSTFPSWDFASIWAIEEGVSYPWLRELPRPVEVGGSLEISSISVSPAALSLQVNETAQLNVTVHYTDGSTADGTTQAVFTSLDSSIAAVEGNTVRGITPGDTEITVTCLGQTVSVPVTVQALVVESLTVVPSSITLPAGHTQQLTVTAHFSDGSTQDVTDAASYQTSDNTKVTVSSSGLVAGNVQGSATVTVSYQGQTVTVPVEVTAAIVESLSVTPSPVILPVGRTQQLTVTATFSDGSVQEVTSQAQYESNDPEKVTVSAGGVVTGLTKGTTSVTVTYQEESMVIPVTVQDPVVESIAVDPVVVELYAGQTQQLTVVAWYSDGVSQEITGEASYGSSDSGKAAVDAGGLITGASEGSAVITVSYEGQTATVQVTVLSLVVEELPMQEGNVPLVINPPSRGSGTGTVASPPSRPGSSSLPATNPPSRNSGAGTIITSPSSRPGSDSPPATNPPSRNSGAGTIITSPSSRPGSGSLPVMSPGRSSGGDIPVNQRQR